MTGEESAGTNDFSRKCVFNIEGNNKQLLPGLLVDSADYHPEKELFPEGNARGK